MERWDAISGAWSLSSQFSSVRETSGALRVVTVRMAEAWEGTTYSQESA